MTSCLVGTVVSKNDETVSRAASERGECVVDGVIELDAGLLRCMSRLLAPTLRDVRNVVASPPGMTTPLAVKDVRLALLRRSIWLCRCPQRAWFMIVSSQQLLVVGLSSTGQPWVCSPPAMQGCLQVQVCLLVNDSLPLSDFRIQRVRALSRRRGMRRSKPLRPSA
jgi:hypothetical protein